MDGTKEFGSVPVDEKFFRDFINDKNITGKETDHENEYRSRSP